MRSKYMTLLLLFYTSVSSAQLVITPGGQFSVFSDTKLTLNNTDLINNGNFFLATTSPVSFTGNVSSFIGGDQAVRFFKMEINKTGSQSVVLHRPINVGSNVLFTSGLFDLNGFNLDLETTGSISGENKDNRFIGEGGGQILLKTTLNAPVSVNPGNLGMVITSGQNLGQVTIKRGHQSQAGSGLTSSILRYFEVSQENNVAANATMRFSYFDEELNGIDENSLSFFNSSDNINWSNIGATSKNSIANFVEIDGTNSFFRFTLSADHNPLPVRFISFSLRCDENNILFNWRTAQEQNTAYYYVEESIDGVNWDPIGRVPATNVAGENNYQLTTGNPSGKMYYRVAEYDIDGKVEYTSVLRSSCDAADSMSVWPNPAHSKVSVNIVSTRQSQVLLKLLDVKGSVVKTTKASLLKGSNQLNLDVASLPNGIYYLSAEWNTGQTSRTNKVVKQ